MRTDIIRNDPNKYLKFGYEDIVYNIAVYLDTAIEQNISDE
jgi:hypothetical protein